MYIEEITGETFNEYARHHMLKNFFQSFEFGELMTHSDYKVMYIATYDNKEIVAASLILYKEIAAKIKYGYAPRGFLIDYYDKTLLKEFTKKVKDYFMLKGFAFIKINPEVTYAILDYNEKSKKINTNSQDLLNFLKQIGYNKLKDNLYFESVLPKYTPIIYLPSYDLTKLDSKIIEDATEASKRGIHLVSGTIDDIPTFYKFVENKKNKTEVYYKYFYEKFVNSGMVDLVFVEVNYNLYAKYLQKQYVYVQAINDEKNKAFNAHPNELEYYNEKIKSDKEMSDVSTTLAKATARMGENVNKEYIAGAFIVKNEGRVTIIITGQSDVYKEIDSKTYLFYKIIEEYKKAGYNYLDLYGITGDFNDNNPYKKLNDFKLKFNPVVYEYIGEFDLVVNKTLHQLLWSTNKIQKEFYKPAIRKE